MLGIRKLFSMRNKGKRSCTINGVRYEGEYISIVDNHVYVDGERQKQCILNPNVTVTIAGDVQEVSNTGNITVQGSVGKSIDNVGNISVLGDVHGDINTTGDVSVRGNVSGSIDTTGNVTIH